MSKFLAIDASTEGCSVALAMDGVITLKKEVAPQGHTKLLLPMVDELLKAQGIKLTDLDAIACGRGPGSFTGVRIGVSLAQGLALGADLKLIGVCDLAAMAYRASLDTNVRIAVSAIDARMGEVYLGIYSVEDNNIKSIIPELVCSPNIAQEKILEFAGSEFTYCGTGFKTYPDIVSSLQAVKAKEDLPWADSIAILADHIYEQGGALPPEDVLPVYLRDKVTWKKVSEQ